jgi:hypothetical protein
VAELRDSGSYVSVAARVARAAGVGGGLACAALAGAIVAAVLVPCRAQGWGCLGYFLLAIVGAPAIAAIAAWPVLYALKVRPALPVAAGGPLAAVAIGWFCAKAPAGGALAVTGVLSPRPAADFRPR